MLQVSIIIPTYNSEAFLERAFASAIAQEGVVFEVVIVDNNSTDGTVGVAERLCGEHPGRARLVYEKVQGAAAARNTGVSTARGAWIQFLDADDALLPGKIARQLSLLQADTDWVVGAYYQTDEMGNQTVSTVTERDPWKGLVHNGKLGNTNANLIRRDVFLSVGGQNETLTNGEDNDLYFRLLKAQSKVVYDDVPGSVYHYHKGYRLSGVKNETTRLQPLGLQQKVTEYLKAEKPQYYKQNAGFFRAALLNEIRRLATENFQEAQTAFSSNFPQGVKPVELDLEIASPLTKLYPLFGFSAVEKTRLFAGQVLPARLKSLMKSR